MKRHVLTVVVMSILAAGALVGEGTAAQATAPQWQTVPGARPDQHVAVWAAGRVWLLGAVDTQTARVVSARVSSGRLTSWVTTRFASTTGLLEGLLGDDLVFQAAGGSTPVLQTVRLLPSGKLGTPTDAAGGAPTQSSLKEWSVVRLRDRAVELVGIDNPRHAAPDLGACCDMDGKPVDYASFVALGSIASLGLDRHGRLWLAWTTRQGPKGRASLVEIDPSSLQPHGKASTVPGLTFTSIESLACGDRCRLVIQGIWRPRRDAAWSWAPGESAPTPIRVPGTLPNTYLGVYGARDVGGRLVVGYLGQDAHGYVVGVARGDVRGGNLHVVRSLPLPASLGSTSNGIPLDAGVSGSFLGPDGLAAVAIYEGGSPYRAVARVAVVPLR